MEQHLDQQGFEQASGEPDQLHDEKKGGPQQTCKPAGPQAAEFTYGRYKLATHAGFGPS